MLQAVDGMFNAGLTSWLRVLPLVQNLNGDQLATLLYFSVFAAQHGMIWLGLDIPGGNDPQGRNRLGSQIGLSSHTLVPEPIDMVTAEYLGERIAKLCSRPR